MADRRVSVILQMQIAQFQQAARQAQAELGQVAKTAGQGEKQMGGMGSTISGKLLPAIAGMAAGFGTFDKVVRGGFERLADLEDARKRMVQMGLSTSEVERLMAGLTDTVTGTAFALNDGADILARFVAAGMDIDEVNDRLTMTADTAAFAQAPLTEIGDIFQRIQSEGRLTGDTLNMLQVRGVPALDLLASAAGTSGEAMRQMISRSEIDAGRFFDLWETGSAGFGDSNIKIEGAAQSMGDTVRGALANAETAFARLGAEILQDFMPAIRDGADAVKDFAGTAIEALGEVGRFSEKTGLEKATEKIKEFNVTGAEFFGNLADSAQKSNDAVGSFFENVFGVENVSLMTLLADETEDAADKTKTFASAMDGAKSATGGMVGVAGEAADEIGGIADVLAETEQAAKDAEQAIKDLTDALFDSGREAIDLEEQQDALADAIDAAKEASKDDEATKREQRAALRDVAAESQDLIGIMVEQEASTEAVRGATESARRKFLEVADAMGVPKEEAVKLADKYGLIPSEVETTVELIGDERAKLKAAEVTAALAAIKSKSVTVTIEERRIKSTYVNTYFRTFGTQGVGGQSAHTGGLLTSSGLKRFHGGGMSDAATLGLRPDERILIAQTGERVLSRQQTAVFDQLQRMMGNTSMAGPSFHRGGVVDDATAGRGPAIQMPRELVVRDVNGQLVGRMRVEAAGVLRGTSRAANLQGRTG